MKLSDRYRRLTLWNKISCWGSISSILALILWLVFPNKTGMSVTVQDSPGAITQTTMNSSNVLQIAGDYVADKKAPRRLSISTTQAMQPALKASQKMTVLIDYPLNDSEGHNLASQIKTIFEDAGWVVANMNPAISEPPRNGISLEFWTSPSGALQAVFAPIFDEFGYTKECYIDTNLAEKTVEVHIGSQ